MTKKETIKAAIVILVGPLGSRNKFEHVVDTVQSVKHYASPDSRIIIQDNSSPLNLGKRLQKEFPDLLISRAPRNYGLYGGLYKSESLAFKYIHDQLNPEVIIMMDSDALFTGYGLEDDALAFFAKNPNVGVMGNYLTDGEGIKWPAQKLRYQTGIFGWLRDRERHDLMKDLADKARARGWVDGTHILGGIAIYNPALIDKLVDLNLLDREPLRRAFWQVDHLFSLLCVASGMDMARFHMPDQPFGVVWRGMPVSPHEIVYHRVKAFHSTRAWKDGQRVWNEDDIRAFFAARRSVEVITPQPSLVNE